MIQPDAKCINNGKKLNETIKGLNSILNNVVSEEIDIVDSNNQPSKRWFVVGKLTGQKQDSDTGDRDNLGNTPNDKNRDSLDKGAGRPIAPGNAGVAPTGNISTGRPLADGSTAADSRAKFLAERERAAGGSANMISVGGTGVDEFGNTIGSAGRPVADGSTAADSRAKFLAARQGATTTPAPLPGAPPLGGDTTPAPLPGAPPLGGDTTPAPLPVEQSPSGGDTTAADKKDFGTLITRQEDKVRKLRLELSRAEDDDKQRYDWEKKMWVYKEFGDPDSPLVNQLRLRFESESRLLASYYQKSKE